MSWKIAFLLIIHWAMGAPTIIPGIASYAECQRLVKVIADGVSAQPEGDGTWQCVQYKAADVVGTEPLDLP